MNPADAVSILDLASTWQIVAAVSTIWAVVATFAAPFISFRLTAKWQTRRERQSQKLYIFASIMQSRAGLIDEEATRSYNLIDTVFCDSRSVRDAWSNYYDSLLDIRLNSNEGNHIRQDKRNRLLHVMSNEIGFEHNFSASDFSRVYWPDGLHEQTEINLMQRQLAKQELQSRLQKYNQTSLSPENTA